MSQQITNLITPKLLESKQSIKLNNAELLPGANLEAFVRGYRLGKDGGVSVSLLFSHEDENVSPFYLETLKKLPMENVPNFFVSSQALLGDQFAGRDALLNGWAICLNMMGEVTVYDSVEFTLKDVSLPESGPTPVVLSKPNPPRDLTFVLDVRGSIVVFLASSYRFAEYLK